MSERAHVPVLIVGAGPTGLTLAAILRRYGIDFRIIERKSELSRHTKATNLMQRNQEILAALGLLEPIANTGGFMRRIMTHAYGKNFGPRTMRVLETPYQDVILCGQHNFEAQMAAGLKRLGTEIAFETELLSLTQNPHGVVAKIAGHGSVTSFSCDYVVGCDGPNGITRTFTKNDFTPKKTGVGLRQVDCTLTWRRLSTMEQMWLFYFDRGFAVVVPLPDGVHRIITVEPTSSMPDREPTLAEMQERLRQIVDDEGVTLTDLRWASFTDLSMGIADALVDGRIMLAGDSGNPILPNGGQGMNTGISDAFNLGWKLAATLTENAAPTDLLATYDAERHKLRAELEKVQFNSLKYTTLVTPAPVRNLIAALGEFALNRGGEYAMARTFSQLSLHTRDSVLTLEGMGENGLRAGDRVQDADVVLQTRSIKLFDVLYRGGWTLLAFTGTSSTNGARLRDTLTRLSTTNLSVYVVCASSRLEFGVPTLWDLDHIAHRVYGVRRPALYLVRPDGYVGARVSPDDAQRLTTYIERWLPGAPLTFAEQFVESEIPVVA